jgi:phosphatidylcholine synthase
MLAIEAVFGGHPRAAILYLLITQIIDGIDGPMARQVDVRRHVPKIDGYVLDLVIDYLTCVMVPALFLHQFHLLPASWSISLAGLVVFTSAIWFARTDMMTDDHWFNGFPGVWNLIAPSMLLAGSSKWLNAAVVVLLCGLMLTNVPFPHPVRVVWMRWLTLPVTVCWLLGLAIGTLRFPRPLGVAHVLLWGSVAYFAALALVRTLQGRSAAGPIGVVPGT